MKIIVTGAAGYIGSNFALAAKAAGCDVVGWDAFTDYYPVEAKRRNAEELRAARLEVLPLDLAREGVDLPLAGADAVVHFAAQPGISKATPWADYFRNNILATHLLVDGCRRAGIERFVNISSSSVYGIHAMDTEASAPKPASWYGVTKLAAEQEVLAAHRVGDLSACSLRLFSVFGERERPEKLFPKVIDSLDRDLPFALFEGSERHERAFTYVGDICEGILAALGQWDAAAGEIFNLGTDQSFTTGQAIATVEEVMGKKACVESVPARLGDQQATRADIAKIRSRLGWEPRTGLRDGVERMVEWYRRSKADASAMP